MNFKTWLFIIYLYSSAASLELDDDDCEDEPGSSSSLSGKATSADPPCTPNCELSTPLANDNAVEVKPWTVFVHIKDAGGGHLKTCVGTIVSSNVVTVNHVCVLDPENEINIGTPGLFPYRHGSKQIEDLNRIKVSFKKESNDPNPISVKEVDYIQFYHVLSRRRQVLVDICGLIVDHEFNYDKGDKRPICISKAEHHKKEHVKPLQFVHADRNKMDMLGSTRPLKFQDLIDRNDCDKTLAGQVERIPWKDDNWVSKCLIIPFKTPFEASVGPVTYFDGGANYFYGNTYYAGSTKNANDFFYFSDLKDTVARLEEIFTKAGSKFCFKP